MFEKSFSLLNEDHMFICDCREFGLYGVPNESLNISQMGIDIIIFLINK